MKLAQPDAVQTTMGEKINPGLRAELEAAPDLLQEGGSVIDAPGGEVLAGPLWGEEGILYADLDLERVVQQRQQFDVVGHYARPDVLSLRLNRAPQSSLDVVADLKPCSTAREHESKE